MTLPFHPVSIPLAAMPHPQIDAARLTVFPLAERKSLTRIETIAADPNAPPRPVGEPLAEKVQLVADRMRAAREGGAAVMLTYGAHLVKNGGGPLVNRMIERGTITHLATQGAGVIHDWEFAFLGASAESVRENAPLGRFGSWDETGRWLNLAVAAGAAEGLGIGEAIGRMVESESLAVPDPSELERAIVQAPGHPLCAARADLAAIIREHKIPAGQLAVRHPYKEFSILARAYRHRVPLTVHPGIGYDIIVNHPMYHGAAIGRAATTDARIFAHSVDRLDGGVYLSVGSAIMSPQVFEKAFSAVNNLRASEGRPFLRGHLIAIVDIQDAGAWDWAAGEPPKTDPAYYLRFCKTFARMAGQVEYLQMDNLEFLRAICSRD